MKNLLLALALLLTLVVNSPVQAQKGWKLGGFFLPQAVNLYNPHDFDLPSSRYEWEPLAGMAVGVQTGYHFNNVFGFRLNVLYSQEGDRYSAIAGTPSARYNFTNRLEYVQVPLLLTLNTNPVLSKWTFAVSAGAQANLLVAAYEYNDVQQVLPVVPEEVISLPSVRNRYADLTYSAVGEIGTDVKVAYKTTLNLGLRLVYGLSDAENKEASVRVRSNGVSQSLPYWEYSRGLERDDVTRHANVGLRIGITYTLGGAY